VVISNSTGNVQQPCIEGALPQVHREGFFRFRIGTLEVSSGPSMFECQFWLWRRGPHRHSCRRSGERPNQLLAKLGRHPDLLDVEDDSRIHYVDGADASEKSGRKYSTDP
jgi:hypothetical protein